MCVCAHVQSCPTLCDPMDYSPPGSSVYGIFQARILDPFPPPGDLPDPGIEPASPVSVRFASGFFTTEPPRKPVYIHTHTPPYSYTYICV